ncbi:histidine N-acetyltransferase-like [Dendronephthya gigantea]|uniref:histidine N-acetyltransferase-like n=1 Tax=Dendronephthya gigantea TaxID=151771 RepID=UPI00106AD0DA|nr:histidine N-acetyltransferase-like [Dendronephthya gigantea]
MCRDRNVRGIYEGHDYLPFVFLRWLEDPNRGIFVAEKEGDVIGIRAFHIIDEGTTVVSQSLRVHREYRRQGISGLLILAENRYVQTHFPRVTTERYTTMSTNVGRLAIHRKSHGENLLLEFGIIAFYINPATVSTRERNCANSQVRKIDSVEFQTLVREGRLDRVLQRGTMVIDWEPFKAVESNVSCGLVNEGDSLFVSKAQKEDQIQGLSHGRLSQRVKCLHWAATIYTENVKLLTVHIAKQLRNATIQARKKSFIFSCFIPTCFVPEAKKHVLDEFSLEYVEFFNFNLMLFEKKFCQ